MYSPLSHKYYSIFVRVLSIHQQITTMATRTLHNSFISHSRDEATTNNYYVDTTRRAGRSKQEQTFPSHHPTKCNTIANYISTSSIPATLQLTDKVIPRQSSQEFQFQMHRVVSSLINNKSVYYFFFDMTLELHLHTTLSNSFLQFNSPLHYSLIPVQITRSTTE